MAVVFLNTAIPDKPVPDTDKLDADSVPIFDEEDITAGNVWVLLHVGEPLIVPANAVMDELLPIVIVPV